MRDWLVNLPAELSESDLIDMVEGTLPPARESVAINALKAEPRLGLLIKQMRADKGLLTDGPADCAPDALADNVLAEIDGRVLRALAAEAQEHSVSIPIHTALIDESTPARVVAESRTFRIMAAAAAIALIGGVTAYVLHEWNTERLRTGEVVIAPGPVGPPAPLELATADPQAATPDGSSSPDQIATSAGATSTQSLNAPSEAVVLGGPNASEAATRTSPPRTTDPGPAPAITPQPSPQDLAAASDSQLSAPAAARFAKEGRLVIILRPKDQTGMLKRLGGLARVGAQAPTTSQRELFWRAIDMERLPAQYASLTTPSSTLPVVAAPPPQPPPAIAGDQGAPQRESTTPAQTAPGPTLSMRPAVKAIFTVEIEATERGLDEAIRALGESRASVSYRVLPAPIAEEFRIEPDSILWWSGSPSRWSKPALVPIIVEGLE